MGRIKFWMLLLCIAPLANLSAQCLNGWSVTRPITVTNLMVSDTLEEYQAYFFMDTQALVMAGEMDSTGADIRFTDATCCNFLCYAIESGMNTDSTKIWVRVPQVLPGDSVTILMAYNNPAATAGQDWGCTFDFWEGFDAVTTRFNQDCGTTTVNVANGSLTLNWSSSGVLSSDSTFSQNYVYTAEAEVTGATGNWPGIYWNKVTDGKGYSLLLGSNQIRIGVASTGGATNCRSENWASPTFSYAGVTGLWQHTWVATGDQRSNFPGYGAITATNTLFTKDADLRLCIGGIQSGTGSMSMDWIRVRKWAETEPAVSIGAPGSFAAANVNLMPDMDICSGDSVELNAGAGFQTYLWNNGSMDSTVWATAGAYWVNVTDSNGCPSADTINIGNYAPVVVSLGADDSICDGDMVTLDAGMFPMYMWSTGDTAQTIDVTTTGMYSVMVTDTNGCDGMDSVNIEVLAAPIANFSQSSNLLTVTFTDLSTNANSHMWDFGNGFTSTQASPVYTYPQAGTYLVCLDVDAGNGCTDTYCDTITVVAVGLEEGLALSLELFPNPAQDMVYLTLPADMAIGTQVTVYDVRGRVAFQQGLEAMAGDRIALNLADLDAGVYFVRIATGEQVYMGKLIVE